MISISFELIGQITALIIVCKLWSSLYYRILKQPKHPLSYGKWVIVTGSTAGIGKEYADYCAKLGMSVLLISRSENKLKDQQKELLNDHKGVEVRYLAYDFTDMGPARAKFYEELGKECIKMDEDGGLGVLINNVGIANQYPELLVENTDKLIADMINCNMDSTVFMSRAVLKVMEPRNKGAIINVSSGSGNMPSPYISVYSATK
jgi:17beta-estradiol 17-dehydrogenase / very-long-chain 3-oxoacyl-CoA reductase